MYRLVNAVQKHEEKPLTFEIPSDDDINDLNRHDYAKLAFVEEGEIVERMWVLIKGYNKDKRTLHGVLSNDPYGLKSIKVGDKVIFGRENILSTMKGGR